MSRLDQYSITVKLGTQDLGVWDKMSGGAVDSEETKYKPGGMAPAVALGGSVTVSNVTVERMFDNVRDLPLVPDIKNAVGKGAVTISRQTLDVDGNPYGTPIVWTGTLKQLTWPDPDSESSAAALIQLEISTDGKVTGGGVPAPH